MLSQLLFCLRRTWPTADTTGSDLMRLEVCPPALLRGTISQPLGWRAWIGAACGNSGSAAPRRAQHRPQQRAAPLAAVRAEFDAAIAGIRDPRALAVCDNIHMARSLRELWHLRADVYTVVATHSSEAEAQRRLTHLNRHFATRTPRAGQPLR